MEVQILDTHGKEKVGHHDCGGVIKTRAPSKNMVKPAGEWNKSRLVIKANNVEHWLNDTQIASYKWGSPEIKAMLETSKFKGWVGFMEQTEGRVVLQHHGEEVWYRNIRSRKL